MLEQKELKPIYPAVRDMNQLGYMQQCISRQLNLFGLLLNSKQIFNEVADNH